MWLEGQACQKGPVGQAKELGAIPIGSRTTEGFPTRKRHNMIGCVLEEGFQRGLTAQCWAMTGSRGRLHAVWGRLVESSDA